MSKQALYRVFIERMESSLSKGNHFEASWYAYAVLEDRLRSALRSTGGEGQGDKDEPIRMLGPKLSELKKRAKKSELLKKTLPFQRLEKWKDLRNDLMHAMAAGNMPLAQIDATACQVAEEGSRLVRELAAAARRLKKHQKHFAPAAES